MAKYYISFILLVYVTMETIRSQAAADTKLTSKEINALPSLKLLTYLQQQQQQQQQHKSQEQNQYHQQLANHLLQNQLQQQHHKRNHTQSQQHYQLENQLHHQQQQQQQPHHEHQLENSNNNEAVMQDLYGYLHIKRHFERQQEHRHQHEQQLHQRAENEDEIEQIHIKSTTQAFPQNHHHHLQHKQQSYTLAEDRMYSDSAPVSHDSQEAVEVPPELPTDMIYDNYYNKEITEAEKFHSNSLEDHYYDSNEPTLKQQEQQQQLENSQTLNTKQQRCPKCASNRIVEQISEKELTNLRIQYVKQQILDKLRLKERPKVSTINLPKPLYEGITIEQMDEQAKSKEFDDYYARTSTKFILLKEETKICQQLQRKPSICFSFKINDADSDSFDVNNAVLWLHKKKLNAMTRNNTILNQLTIVVNEVQEQQSDPKFIPILKPIAIKTVSDKEEWTTINTEWSIKRWFGNHDLSHLIHISCESCDIESMDELISAEQDYQPFIMIDAKNRRRISRPKRAINCTNGVNECCRDELYISFEAIGWGDWIIQPKGYNAYFCRGSCSSVASVTNSLTIHNSIINKLVNLPKTKNTPSLELVPCCTAEQYSPLTLLFSSNNSVEYKIFPNMIVKSCGCR